MYKSIIKAIRYGFTDGSWKDAFVCSIVSSPKDQAMSPLMFIMKNFRQFLWLFIIVYHSRLNIFHTTVFFVCPSVFPYVNSRVCPNIRQSVHLSVQLSVQSARPTVHPTDCLSIQLSVHQSINPTVRPIFRKTVNLTVHPSVYPSVSQ